MMRAQKFIYGAAESQTQILRLRRRRTGTLLVRGITRPSATAV